MKKISLKQIFVAIAAFFALLVLIFSFVAAFRVHAGTHWVEYKNIIWGCGKYAFDSGNVTALDPKYGAVVLPLIGTILVFLGGSCACVFGFFGEKLVKDAKTRRIISFIAAGVMVLGGIFLYTTSAGFKAVAMKEMDLSESQLDVYWNTLVGALSHKESCGLPIVSGALSLVGGACVVLSEFIKK